MRRVMVICVGKLKERFYQEAAAEYCKRLGRYCRLEVAELPEQRLSEAPSPAEIERALAKEAEMIRSRAPAGASLAALCVEGVQRSSEEFRGREIPQIKFLLPFARIEDHTFSFRQNDRMSRCPSWAAAR